MVRAKESFDDWERMVKALVAWDVLLPDAAQAFRDLMERRHAAVHFRPEVDDEVRTPALEAIRLLTRVIEVQFAAFGAQPWFIPGVPGMSFLRKASEDEPFVRRVYVPNSVLVGPRHLLERVSDGWRVSDADDYPDEDVTDDEFVRLLGESA